MSEFKLLIDRLNDKPQRFDFEAGAEWWSARAALDESQAEGQLERPLRFGLDASRLGESVLIQGTFEGGVFVECSRCTRRYAHALRDSFRLVLEPLKDSDRGDGWGEGRRRESIDPEGERALAENGLCLGDDLEAGFFRGPVIFLDDFFAEIVALAMPIQPLCEEDCPGLCPHCGMERPRPVGVESRPRAGEESPTEIARESAVCGCADERVESPFAVLAKLKSGSGAAPQAGDGRTGKTGSTGETGKAGKAGKKVESTRGTGSGRRR